MSDNSFQTAAKAALPALYALGGVTVTYARGAASVSLTAIRNDRGVDVADAEGVYTRVVRTEYQVKQADLVLSEVTATPQRGDVITDGARTYNVQEGAERLDESGEWAIPVVEVL